MATTEYGVDQFFSNAGTSPKMVYDVAGVLRWSPHNMIRESQTMGVAWTLQSATLVVDQATAPDGTMTMDKIYPTSTGISRWIQGTAPVALPAGFIGISFSVYAKMAGKRWIALGKFDGSAMGAWFDLQSGVVGTVVAGYTSSIQSVGDGIYRCTITSNVTTVFNYWLISVCDADNNTNVVANGTDGVYLWGAQINRGAVATAYLPTTTAARIGLALDYDPVTLAAKGLLCEPAATNLQRATATPTDATSWLVGGTTVTSAGIAPTGGAAFALTEDTALGGHNIVAVNGTAAGLTSGTVYTVSGYVKANGRTRVRMFNFSLNNLTVFFDLTSGTTDNVSGGTAPVIRMTPVGNGWYRWEITDTATATGQHRPSFDLVSTGTTISYTGNGTSGVYLWNHMQVETGSVATSPIPTFAATVTRAVDNYSVTPTSINHSATAGSWWVEYFGQDAPGSTGRLIGYASNGNITAPLLYRTNSPYFGLLETTNLQQSVSSAVGLHKVASTWQSGDRAITSDARTVIVDTGATANLAAPGALVGFGSMAGGNPMLGYIRKVRYVPRRKSNAELVTETTL